MQSFLAIPGYIFHYTIMAADDSKEDVVDFGCGETRVKGNFFIWEIRLPVVIDPLAVPVGKITRSICIEVKI